MDAHVNARPEPRVAGYAPVNGLEMYYEIYGSGPPLVLLHGGMTTGEDFSRLIPPLAQTRQLIAFERQGHGHTADINRPFSLEQWADDTAELLRHLEIDRADMLGFSTGGTTALAFALRHSQMVRKLVLISALHHREGYYPGMMEALLQTTPESMPDVLHEMYTRVAPHPEHWPKLIEKSVALAAAFEGWQKREMRTIQVPTLVMVGDQDFVRTEHAVDLYRLIPHANLAVLPVTTHAGVLFQRAEWTAEMVNAFLAEPIPEAAAHAQGGSPEHDFPRSIGRPARDALLTAGYTRLEQLTGVREEDILALHGVGPKAIRILRATLAERGWTFANSRVADS